MKKLFAILPLLISTVCLAGAKGGFNEQDSTGIVTPNIATAVRRIVNFTYDTEGNLVVCTEPYQYQHVNEFCMAPDGSRQWQHVRSIVPKNRTYVGFKVVSGYYGTRQLEVYWK